MRTMVFAAFSCLSLISCDDTTEVVAGDVVVRRAATGALELSGPFEIRKADLDRAVISAGKGGACLVANLGDRIAIPNGTGGGSINSQCAVDSDCDVVPDPAQPGAKWHGYCLPDDPALANSPKRCWVKPSEAYCKKNVGVDVHSTPTVSGEEVYRYAAAHPSGRAVRWRVTACLNGPGTGLAGCAGGDGTMMRDYGAIATPPPPRIGDDLRPTPVPPVNP